MKLLIFIILITIIYVFFYMGDCGCNEKMTNITQESLEETQKYFEEKNKRNPYISIDDNNFSDDNTDAINAQLYKYSLNDIPKVVKIQKNKKGRVNINTLPKCQLPIKANYSTNTNIMINDGKKIIQDMIKPNEQKSIIANESHDLKQVAWTKSKLNWYGVEIPLEIRLTHINTVTQNLTHIIFPIKLVDTDKKESFYNTIENFSNLLNFDIISKLDNEINNLSKTDLVSNLGNLSKTDIISKLGNEINNLSKTDLISKLGNEIGNLSKTDIISKLSNEVNNLSKTDLVSKLGNLSKTDIASKLDNEINNLSKTDIISKLSNEISNLSKKEIIIKVKEIDSKLTDVKVDKLDLKSLITTNVNLENLNKKLKDMNFNKIVKKFNNQKFSLNDINSLLNLNTLVEDKENIPTYNCCAPNFGKVINVNLCPTATKVLDQETFYYLTGNDNSIILITKPQPFDKISGQKILNNLDNYDDLF